MFSGIVSEIGRIETLADGRISVACVATSEGLEVGASVAVNGVCLTAAVVDRGAFAADVMPETLARSALAELSPGSPVNLERALRYGAEVGGHLVQGHIDGVGRVARIDDDGNARRVRIDAPATILRFCVEKASIAVDGVSLTITAVDARTVEFSLIPQTMSATIAGTYEVGTRVNLEVDLMAKYVERYTSGRHGE